MARLFLARQLLTAGLAGIAIRPLPGMRGGVFSFFAGSAAVELAPHLLALTAADVATHLTRRRRDPVALTLAAGSAAGLAFLVDQSRRVRQVAEDALVEGIGADYAEQLDALPTPAEERLPVRSLVYPFSRRAPGVRIERDIAYGPAGRRNLLDLYLPDPMPEPAPESGLPVLVQVHGGAWCYGSKEFQGLPLMRHLAAKGWVCVAVNYRLSPRSRMPDHIVDVKRAIAWVRAHIADYGGDPAYVAITGGSAGGHLASLAAVTAGDADLQPGFEDADTSVQVAVPHYGVYDFAGVTGLRSAMTMRDAFLAPKVVQRRFADDPEAFEQVTPLVRIGEDAPDFFVLHGTSDSLVDVGQARAFVARLREVSHRSVVYAELPSAQHAFDLFPSIRSTLVVRAVDRYLHWHWNGWRQGRTTGA